MLDMNEYIRNNGQYIVCDKEMSVIKEMQYMREQGQSYQSISDNLHTSTPASSKNSIPLISLY